MSVKKQWKNQNASDFGFSDPGILRKPWLDGDPVESAKKIEKSVKEENRQHRNRPGISDEDK